MKVGFAFGPVMFWRKDNRTPEEIRIEQFNRQAALYASMRPNPYGVAYLPENVRIISGAIAANKIQAGSITASHIRSNSI